MSKRKGSLVVTEAEWADAVRVARVLRHRKFSTEWRIRRVVSIAAYLLGHQEQAEEIRTRRLKP